MSEFTGRYAIYCTGDRAKGIIEEEIRLSLNSVRTNFGTRYARLLLQDKQVGLGNTHWLELVLVPGEKTAEETEKESRRLKLCRALFGDLRQSYPSLTLAGVTEDVDKLIAGEKPVTIIQMFAQPYLIQLGLVKE